MRKHWDNRRAVLVACGIFIFGALIVSMRSADHTPTMGQSAFQPKTTRGQGTPESFDSQPSVIARETQPTSLQPTEQSEEDAVSDFDRAFVGLGRPVDVERCRIAARNEPMAKDQCSTVDYFTVCARSGLTMTEDREFVAEAAGEIWSMYGATFQVAPDAIPTVFLYSQQEWVAFIEDRIPGNQNIIGLYDGAVHLPWVEFPISPYLGRNEFEEFLSTLRHELLHGFLFGLSDCIPVSLHEGLAEWFQGSRYSPHLPIPWAVPMGPEELELALSDLSSQGGEANGRARAEGWLRVSIAVEKNGSEVVFPFLGRQLYGRAADAGTVWSSLGTATREEMTAYAIYANFGYRPHPGLIEPLFRRFGMALEKSSLSRLGWSAPTDEVGFLEGELEFFRGKALGSVKSCGGSLMVDRLGRWANGVKGRATLCYPESGLLDYPMSPDALAMEYSISEHWRRNAWQPETPQGVRVAFASVNGQHGELELVETSKQHESGVPLRVTFVDGEGRRVSVELNRWGVAVD